MATEKDLAPVAKNQTLELFVEDMTDNGEGIGKKDGYPLFVSGAVVGDRVEALVLKAGRGYGFAKTLRVIEPSPDRVEPRCPVAAPCGGCQLQNLSYEAQLAFKQKKVSSCLSRIGGIAEPPVRPILGMEEPWRYRNKAQYPVAPGEGDVALCGFYGSRSHRIVQNQDCLLGSRLQTRILVAVKDWMEECDIEPYDETTGRGLLRHILIRDNQDGSQAMVCLVINARKLPEADRLAEHLAAVPSVVSISYNINLERNNVILGRQTKPVKGPLYIEDRIGDNLYRVSPGSFFQVNKRQTAVLYREALAAADLSGTETVWDLYCGTGTITLFLAQSAAKVYGVEVAASAVKDAKANAARNGIANAEFFEGRAEEFLPALYREGKLTADVVVVDPPRKGCGKELVDTLLELAPGKIVYVSCDPATLARDVKLLSGKYDLVYAQPVDMFPQTVGVECVCKLVKKV